MPDIRPADLVSVVFRVEGWLLLALGAMLGIVTPWPVTAAVWTAAARAFAHGGDTEMVLRLMSAAKFGPRIRRDLDRPPARRLGGLREA